MSLEEATALVRRLYTDFDRGTLDSFAELIGPGFTASVLGTTTLDWSGFKQFGDAFREAFPNGRHEFDYFVPARDMVVTVGRYRGTHTGPINGIAPTHAELDLPVMHLDRVENGKLVEHRGLANELDFMRQLSVR